MSSVKKLASLNPVTDVPSTVRPENTRPALSSKLNAAPPSLNRNENSLGPIASRNTILVEKPVEVTQPDLGELRPLRNSNNPFSKSDALGPIKAKEESEKLERVTSDLTQKPINDEPESPPDFDKEKLLPENFSASDAINVGEVDNANEKSRGKSITNSSSSRESDEHSSSDSSQNNYYQEDLPKDRIKKSLFKNVSSREPKAINVLNTHDISPSLFPKLLSIHRERISSDPLKIAIGNGDLISVEVVRQFNFYL